MPLKIFILSKRDVFLCLSLGNVSFRWRVLVVVKDDFHPLAAKIGIRHPLNERDPRRKVLHGLASWRNNGLPPDWLFLCAHVGHVLMIPVCATVEPRGPNVIIVIVLIGRRVRSINGMHSRMGSHGVNRGDHTR